MLIITHIVVAILGIVMASLTALRPTRRRQRSSLALTGLTLYSGALLVVRLHANLGSVCLTGISYLVVVAALLAVGQWRLSRQL